MYFMKLTKKKKVFAIKNKAFTLTEALISIFVMSSIFFLLLNFSLILKENLGETSFRGSFIVSLVYIKEDIIESQDYKIINGDLLLYKYNGEKISYTYNKNRLVRKVEDKGYEIILSNVKNAFFEEKNKVIYLNVEFINVDNIEKEVVYDFK